MKILGIETSCDETAAAVVEDGKLVVSSVVASSAELQAKYGGVVPEQAAREQVKAMIPVVNEALIQAFPNAVGDLSPKTSFRGQAASPWDDTFGNLGAGMIAHNVDAIAVTVGPGLIGSLLIGVETAKTLSFVLNKPIVPVNHLVGHVYGCWLKERRATNENQGSENLPEFPALVLLVSGGHTDLVLMRGHGDFNWVSGTRDDAAGECFDKTARILGLPYPGGPSISKAAEVYLQELSEDQQGTSKNLKVKLPRPLINSHDFDFSFSGLKTAVLNEVNRAGMKSSAANDGRSWTSQDDEIQKVMAYEVQEAITDVLVKKTIDAALELEVESVLVVGGVAANKVLREKIADACETNGLKLYIPAFKFCTDNAAYIASAAYFNYHPIPWSKVDADSGLTIGV